MNDMENTLRDVLAAMANRYHPEPAPPAVVLRRALRRLTLFALATLISVCGIAFGAIAGIRGLTAPAARLGTSPPAATSAQIAFVRPAPGYGQPSSIYLMGADGSHIVRLTTPPPFETDGFPAWSPDGSRVAFVRGGAPQVYILGADGSGLHPVTTVAGGGYTSPSWSPSGNELVLAVGLAGVYLVRPDGSDLHAIYRPTGRLAHGFVNWTAWSPDGEHILFGLYPINGRDEVGLFTIRPDGSGLRELMAGPIGGPAAWSPDSKKIVVSVSGGLQLMNADGSHRVQLTPAGPNANDFWPTWSPDGNLIAFTRQITTEQIWVMNADGTGQHALTSGLQSDQPAWRP